jgi:phosphoserine phosphatase
MNKAIYFDMDGTIADLYGVSGWLADLEAEREELRAERAENQRMMEELLALKAQLEKKNNE